MKLPGEDVGELEEPACSGEKGTEETQNSPERQKTALEEFVALDN